MGQSTLKEIDVSIIIVNHNSLDLLSDCLRTLHEFTKDVSFEVIIVDNNTTEGNIDDIVNPYPKVTLIKNDSNRGFGPANNQGLEIAGGEYILFLNNDTKFIENSVKIVLDFVLTRNEDIIIGPKLLNSDFSLQRSTYKFPSPWETFCSNLFLYLIFPKSRLFSKFHLMNNQITHVSETDVVIGAFLFCKFSLLKKLGGFDEKFYFYSEETDLCYRLKKGGGKILYFPDTSVLHVKAATVNKNLWFKYLNQSVAQIKFFQKHFSRSELIFSLAIHYFGIFIRIPLSFIGGLVSLNKELIFRAVYYLRLLFIYPENKFKS